MRIQLIVVGLFFMWALAANDASPADGITPEQIYQPALDWSMIVGTWEILQEDSPLSEKQKQTTKASYRTLMTLRKDGTCRIINEKHQLGENGIWVPKDHELSLTLGNGERIDLYIYGIKGDFMVTKSQGKDRKEELWSRVK